MTELGVRVGCKFFCEFDHIFNSFIRTVSGSMVDIDCLEFNIKWRHIKGIEPDDVLPDDIDFLQRLIRLISRFSCDLMSKVMKNIAFLDCLARERGLCSQIFLHFLFE